MEEDYLRLEEYKCCQQAATGIQQRMFVGISVLEAVAIGVIWVIATQELEPKFTVLVLSLSSLAILPLIPIIGCKELYTLWELGERMKKIERELGFSSTVSEAAKLFSKTTGCRFVFPMVGLLLLGWISFIVIVAIDLSCS